MNLENISKKDYTLNDIADMTGTTIRTLRIDIKNGLLCGNKSDGKWSFAGEEKGCDIYVYKFGNRKGIVRMYRKR